MAPVGFSKHTILAKRPVSVTEAWQRIPNQNHASSTSGKLTPSAHCTILRSWLIDLSLEVAFGFRMGVLLGSSITCAHSSGNLRIFIASTSNRQDSNALPHLDLKLACDSQRVALSNSKSSETETL